MLQRLFLNLRTWDGALLTITLFLLGLGLAEILSSGLAQGTGLGLFWRQLFGAILGLIAMFIIASIDYRILRSWSRLIYFGGILLLILVLIFGVTIRGTTGWFNFGLLTFQPVELVKIAWIITLAAYLTMVGPPLTWLKTVNATFLLLPLVGLILWQPDFGSAFLLIAVWGAMLCAMPKPKKWWLVMGAFAIVVLLVGTLFLKPYQKDRLMVFFNPQADPLGSGYNVRQSIIAVGSGQILGRGLGLGTQSQLRFLPEQHSDFIFASITEELGLVGGILILGLWFGFFYRIYFLMRRARDDFAVLLALGIFSLFAVQVVLNIGMNLGLAPVVGITLPFMSSGSSSLVASLLMVGVLQNLARAYGKRAPAIEVES
ncbi:MAG: FtsW/RodA/SpoVE family cell cycle protein [Patescibacteria group bacterium]